MAQIKLSLGVLAMRDRDELTNRSHQPDDGHVLGTVPNQPGDSTLHLLLPPDVLDVVHHQPANGLYRLTYCLLLWMVVV